MDSMGLGMLADQVNTAFIISYCLIDMNDSALMLTCTVLVIQHVFQVLLLHSVLEPFSCTSINNEVYFLDQAYIHSG